MTKYDLIIIGAGPGGFEAALKASELGAKVCLIEKALIGGTCLNKGCIPTKAILASIRLLRDIKRARDFGIKVDGCTPEIEKIQKRKDEIVSKLRHGAESRLKSKNVDVINAAAAFIDKKTVSADGRNINSENIIIATGSLPYPLGSMKFDHKYILSSDDILNLQTLPKSIIIIGAGYIGCEFAVILNELGVKVTVVELMEQILPSVDREIAKRLEANFKRSGIEIIKGKKVVSADTANSCLNVRLQDDTSLEAQKALLCIGRRPNIDSLGLDKAGVEVKEGSIPVNKKLRTNIPNIYAIGDVTGRYYLAHVASYEGALAAENIFGNAKDADYSSVPSCIFTFPEIATAGIDEKLAEASGISFKTAKIPFAAISKAHTAGETEGIIKLVAGAEDNKILGAQIYGACASEIIAEFTIAIKAGMTAKQLGEIIYAHPTFSEGIKEIKWGHFPIKLNRDTSHLI